MRKSWNIWKTRQRVCSLGSLVLCLWISKANIYTSFLSSRERIMLSRNLKLADQRHAWYLFIYLLIYLQRNVLMLGNDGPLWQPGFTPFIFPTPRSRPTVLQVSINPLIFSFWKAFAKNDGGEASVERKGLGKRDASNCNILRFAEPRSLSIEGPSQDLPPPLRRKHTIWSSSEARWEEGEEEEEGKGGVLQTALL